MLPILVVLLDGLGDRACPEHGGYTANEAAETPNLDLLCAAGSCGLLHPLGPGRTPSSEVAHWALLGCLRDEFPGRAVLEARGHGQAVDPADVLAYAALRPAEFRDGNWWLTGRPDPQADAAECQRLLGRCAEIEAGGFSFRLSPLSRGEAILRVRSGADDQVTDTDSFFRDRDPLLFPLPLRSEAAATAAAVEAWTREVMARLDGERFPLITLKWWGRARTVPSFRERHGISGSLIGAAPFLAGLAQTLGLEPLSIDEEGDPAVVLRHRLEFALDRLQAGETFVFIHQKSTDEAGHTKDPTAKRAMVEMLDTALGALPVDRAIVCVTGDHTTPTSSAVIHSGDPVPLVVAGPNVRADEVTGFGELLMARGILGRLCGEDVLPVLLNAADRALFLGSRPTPVPEADGYPAAPKPFV